MSAPEPRRIYQGESLSWDRELPDYSADDGWALTYYLNGRNVYSVTTTGSGSTFSVAKTSAETGAWEPGVYSLLAFATKGTERVLVFSATLEIKPDPTTVAEAYNELAQAKRDLNAIDLVLSKRITKDVQSYAVEGRQLTKMTASDLLELRSFVEARVRRLETEEDLTREVGSGSRVLVRMR